MTQDFRVDLKSEFDLQKEMPCNNCGKLLSEPDYKCSTCDIQLVFYAKK